MAIRNIIESISITDYLLIFILILITNIINFYYKYFTRPNPLPGPFPLPFIGNNHNVGYDIKQFYTQCQQKYGDICEVMLDRRYIILTRPEYIKKIFASAKFFMKLPNSQGTDELGMNGHGIIFNEDPKSWHHNKRFFTEALSSKFIDESIKSTNQLYEDLSGYWQSLGKQKTLNNNNNWELETDLSGWLHGFANDIISILITGKRTYSIASYYNKQSNIKSKHSNALVEDGEKFVDAIIKLNESLLLFALLGPFTRHYFPIIRNLSNSYLNNRDYIFKNLIDIINERRNEIKEIPESTETKTDMLTSLITANISTDGKMSKPMTDEDIRGNLLDAFMGGTDTSANAFCFITYYLCKHPNVKQKMLSEIDSILPKSSDKFYVSHDNLKRLKYCEAIIKETSRVMTVVNFTLRYVAGECEIAGLKWPAGTEFLLNIAGIHGRPDFWPNPEVFDPDRFYNTDDDDKDKPAFMMFGIGKRYCPGKNLAMTELLILMALIYKNYNIELVNIHEPLKIFSGIINNCQELKVRISPRIYL